MKPNQKLIMLSTLIFHLLHLIRSDGMLQITQGNKQPCTQPTAGSCLLVCLLGGLRNPLELRLGQYESVPQATGAAQLFIHHHCLRA